MKFINKKISFFFIAFFFVIQSSEKNKESKKKKSLKNLISFKAIPCVGLAYLVFKKTLPVKKIRAKI